MAFQRPKTPPSLLHCLRASSFLQSSSRCSSFSLIPGKRGAPKRAPSVSFIPRQYSCSSSISSSSAAPPSLIGPSSRSGGGRLTLALTTLATAVLGSDGRRGGACRALSSSLCMVPVGVHAVPLSSSYLSTPQRSISSFASSAHPADGLLSHQDNSCFSSDSEGDPERLSFNSLSSALLGGRGGGGGAGLGTSPLSASFTSAWNTAGDGHRHIGSGVHHQDVCDSYSSHMFFDSSNLTNSFSSSPFPPSSRLPGGSLPGVSIFPGGVSGGGSRYLSTLSSSSTPPPPRVPVQHEAFEILSETAVPELQLYGVQYRHKQTGAIVMSLEVPEKEKEKVFCVCYRTPVSDSMGIPHILEHSVLCGSKKYPLKEPFVELLKGSLFSYLNALTYADRTCYPVASANEKDFYNLASVYFDAVIQPRAIHDPHVLQQEGWRLEATSGGQQAEQVEGAGGENKEEELPSVVDQADKETGNHAGFREEKKMVDRAAQTVLGNEGGDDTSDVFGEENRMKTRIGNAVKLEYQGVVLNEMKGVYSSPDSRMARLRMQTLFPDVPTYRNDSGGSPDAIPSLTFEKFVDFFHRYYHPSNAKIFFWGSDDVKKRLDFVNENLNAIKNVKYDPALAASTAVPEQKAISGPVRLTRTYPASKDQLEDMVTVGWLLNPQKKPGVSTEIPAFEILALDVLGHMLLATPASPLYRALTASGLGKRVVGPGKEDLKQTIFSAGLKGIPQKKAKEETAPKDGKEETGDSDELIEQVEKIVLNCIEKCAKEGFEQAAIDAAINSTEFTLREFNTGSLPKGLVVILQIMSDWNSDRDPFTSLRFEAPLEELKRRLKDGEPVFQNLLNKYFVNNKHRVTVHLKADPSEERRTEEEEEKKIAEIRKSLTDGDIKKLEEETKELKALQIAEDSPEALATLPSLTLADIDKVGEEVPTTVSTINYGSNGEATLLTHPLPTAGLLYADFLFPLHELTVEELQLLDLYSRLLTEAGTSKRDENALTHHIGRHTGGIGSVVDIRTVAEKANRVADPYRSFGYFVVRGKVVKDKIGHLYNIIQEITTDANLGNARRGREILKELLAAAEAIFLRSGNVIGSRRIFSRCTATGYIAEKRGGYSYLLFLRELRQQAEADWSVIEEKLKRIRQKLLHCKTERVIVNLTGDETTLAMATSGETPGKKESSDEEEAGLSLKQSLEKMLIEPSSLSSPSSEESEPKKNRIPQPCAWALKLRDEISLLHPGGRNEEDSQQETPEGFVIPTQVNYVAAGGRLYYPDEEYTGHQAVVALALSTGYVWDQVRVLGGAYGGSFHFDSAGIFSFTSYRDPQLHQTLERYRDAAAHLKSFAETLDERTLTRSILGVIRSIDKPIRDEQKGYRGLWEFITQRTPEDRRKFRTQVLETKPEHFVEFAKRLERQMSHLIGGNEAVGLSENQRVLVQREPSGITDGETAKGKEEREEDLHAKKGALSSRAPPRNIIAVVGSSKAFEEATKTNPKLQFTLHQVMKSS